MSVPRPGSPDRQRLLPSTVEHSLHDLAIRFTGCALVAFSATSWLALLSWRLRDASATGPAAKAAKNLLGSAGAGLSDMMVHTLGVAVVFALICPMIWGLELLASVRWIPGMRLKIVASIGAIAALTGTASGLPNVPGWPLLGGSGGMLGDLVHNLAASVVFRATLCSLVCARRFPPRVFAASLTCPWPLLRSCIHWMSPSPVRRLRLPCRLPDL